MTTAILLCLAVILMWVAAGRMSEDQPEIEPEEIIFAVILLLMFAFVVACYMFAGEETATTVSDMIWV